MLKLQRSAPQPAIVIVGGDLNGLGLVRALARRGLAITVVDATLGKAAMWSRHVQRCVIRKFTGREFIEDMVALGRRFATPPVLMLTDEDAVHAVSENRAELSKWYRFLLPSDDNVKLLSNKAVFHRFAEAHDFPVPRTAILATAADLPLLEGLEYPCVIKPDDKRQALSGQKERAVRADTLEEAQRHAGEMLRTPGGIVAQEWIEGPESNIYFTLFYRNANGNMSAMFTGRKILCSPPDVGSTAVCIAAPEAREALEPLTAAIAECAGFDGMGSMEYKWDDRRGRFMIIEPTVGRSDWQEEIAALCGVNIPLAAYRTEAGLPTAISLTPSVAPAIAWRATLADRPPEHLLPGPVRVVDGYFRWSDPLPAIQHYCLRRALDRRLLRQWKVLRKSPIGA